MNLSKTVSSTTCIFPRQQKQETTTTTTTTTTRRQQTNRGHLPKKTTRSRQVQVSTFHPAHRGAESSIQLCLQLTDPWPAFCVSRGWRYSEGKRYHILRCFWLAWLGGWVYEWCSSSLFGAGYFCSCSVNCLTCCPPTSDVLYIGFFSAEARNITKPQADSKPKETF